MKTRKFSLARIMTAALVLLLTFALAIPAFASSGNAYAEGPFHVTVTPDESTAIPKDESDTTMVGRFKAYAIFVGNIYETGSGEDAYQPGVTDPDSAGIRNPNSNTLFNISWGDGIDVDKFMNALLEDKTVTLGGKSIKEALQSYYPKIEEATNFKTDAIAEAVAKMLSENVDNGPLVRLIARLAADAKTTGVTSTWKQKTDPADGEDAWKLGTWDIELKQAGYYLIVDEFRLDDPQGDPIPTDTSVSAFILGVFGTSTVNMKATTPTPDKNIMNPDDHGNHEGSAFEVGQKIKFQLSGTLPENYDEYSEYFYAFHDTLSNGLTYLPGEGVDVYIVTAGEKYVLKQGQYHFDPAGTKTESGTLIGVVIDNLKTLTTDATDKNIVISHTSKIYVEYTAEINEESVIYGSAGNPNTLWLEFTNNPNTNSHGKSEEIKVYVYTFGLNVYKESDDKKEELPGAKFAIYDKDPTESDAKRAYFTKVVDPATSAETYTLQGWYGTGEEIPSDPADMVDTVVTGEDGFLNIRGLSSNTYYLKETEAPRGYNLLKNPIIVDIATDIDSDTGILNSFTVTVTNSNMSDGTTSETVTTYSDVNVPTIFQSGVIPQTIVNYRAPLLPGTGGIGLVIFYVLGGLLLVGAATYIIVSGRKKSKQQQQ